MSYSEFSTQRADYVLQLEFHRENNQGIEIFDGCDAIVLEGTPSNGFNSVRDLMNFYKSLGDKNELVNLIKTKRKKLFNVDIGSFDRITYFDCLQRTILDCFHLISSIFMSYEARRNEKIQPISRALISATSFLDQDYIGTFRNAITAKKLEEFVAPRLGKELGRKPRIGIVYGTGHAGLEGDLKHSWKRNFTITNYQYFDLFRTFRPDANQVLEIDFSNGSQFRRYAVPIFTDEETKEETQ
jgi:hypothetical protein